MKQPRVKSKFKENENFDFRNTPKKFESVSDKSMRELKSYSLNSASKNVNGNFTPNSLQATLQAIVGQFNFALARLEGDYSARKNNLENAYVTGLAEVEAQIFDFEKLAEDHNEAFEEYARAYAAIYGDRPSENLLIKQAKIEEIKKAYEKLGE